MSNNRGKTPANQNNLDDNDEKQSATISSPRFFSNVPSLQELAVTHLLTELNKKLGVFLVSKNVDIDDEDLDNALNKILEKQKISEKSSEAIKIKELIKQVRLECDKFRELILQVEDRHGAKKVINQLKSYQDYPYLLCELIFSKGTAQEKFVKHKEFTRTHEGKSAWELMIWAHNYDLLFEPLKKFVELADPTKKLANSQTPHGFSELQLTNSGSAVASAAAPIVEHSGKDEKTLHTYDFESLIKAISKDPCTDKNNQFYNKKAMTLNLQTKVQEFENVYSKIKDAGLLNHYNVQMLQDAYKAHIDNFDLWSSQQKELFQKLVIDPLVFSLPAGFASHIEDYLPFSWELSMNERVGPSSSDHLIELCAEKAEHFSQLVDWLKSPAQTLEHNQTSRPR